MADNASLFTLQYAVQNEVSFLNSINKASSASSNLTASSAALGIEQDKLQTRYAAVAARLSVLEAQAAAHAATIQRETAVIGPLVAQYGALGDRIVATTAKLEQAQAAQNPQLVGAYKGQLSQLTAIYGQVGDQIDSLQKSLAKERQGFQYASVQVDVKKARLAELNVKLQETDQLLEKTGKKGFLQSVITSLHDAVSSWSNFSKAVDQASITLDRLTRSGTRGVKIANTISSALFGKQLFAGGAKAGGAKPPTQSVQSFTEAVSSSKGPLSSFQVALAGVLDPMGALGFVSLTVSTIIANLATQVIVGGVRALVGFAQAAFAPTAALERLGLSLKSLVGQELVQSGRAKDMKDGMAQAAPVAQGLLKWIQQLAIQSPFSVNDIRQSFLLAKSYGFTAAEAKRLTQVLTDWAAATGRTGAEMERVTLALSQMKTAGKLNGQDIRQLAQAGVSVDQILARAFNKTTAQIIQMRQDGLIPANEAIEAIVSSLQTDFGGAAAAQAKSLSGLVSSLGDIGQLLLTNLFGPIDQASGKVGGLLGAIQGQMSGFVDFLTSGPVTEAVRYFGTALGGLANDAFSWGSNIVQQLANGMLSAIFAVLDAIASIGNTIASLMAPGSPPAFLPDIDTWGAETFKVYMQGWTKFGAQVFNDVAGQIETFLKGISTNILPETQLIPTIVGTRSAIALATKELETIGQVSESTIRNIIASMGSAGASTEGYVRALFNAAAAQKALDDVTNKYDTQLKGLNSQLDALVLKQQDAQDDKDIARLTRISQDAGASEARRAKAKSKLDELILRKKIRDTEAEKKIAVDAAQTKLNSAQSELESRKALIDFQVKQNDLTKEQVSLLERLAKASAGAAGGGRGAGGPKIGSLGAGLKVPNIGAGFSRVMAPINGVLGSIQSKLGLIGTVWERVWTKAAQVVQPLSGSFTLIKSSFDKLVGAFQQSAPAIEASIGRIIARIILDIPKLKPLFDSLGLSLGIVADLWSRYGDNIIFIVETFIIKTIDFVVLMMDLVGFVVLGGMTAIQTTISVVSTLIHLDWVALWNQFLATVVQVGLAVFMGLTGWLGAILLLIINSLSFIQTNWSSGWGAVKSTLSSTWDAIVSAISGKVSAVQGAVSAVINGAKNIVSGAIGSFVSLGSSLISGLKDGIMSKVGEIVNAIRSLVNSMFSAGQNEIDAHSPSKKAAKLWGAPVGQGLALGMLGTIPLIQKTVSQLAGASVRPPASPSQQMSSSLSYSTTNNYNYAPTYGAAPNNPRRDFAVMQVLAGA